MLFNCVPLKIDSLPSVVTLLPLRGLILVPRSELRLPISDFSSLAMVTSAIRCGSYVGVVQLRDKDGENEDVFRCGCVGRVSDCHESNDGQLAFVVQGICRFEIIKELPREQNARQAEVSYDKYQLDVVREVDYSFDRERLLDVLKRCCSKFPVIPQIDELAAMSNEKLISMLMMVWPFDPYEKQALLETEHVLAQSNLITSLLELDAGMKDSILYH
ncbi:MAG: LON peptidase substrate-binding domain-containing protein [Holosporales bacterium]|jgi:Lon protease-like protein|nr:LON peptidase substrate-binding domain-containing protein [Holosporales bacterium]